MLFLSGLADDSRRRSVERSQRLAAEHAKPVLGEFASVVQRQPNGHRLFVIVLDLKTVRQGGS